MGKKDVWEHHTTGIYVRGYTPFSTHERPYRRWLSIIILASCILLVLLLLSNTLVDGMPLGTWLVGLLAPRDS